MRSLSIVLSAALLIVVTPACGLIGPSCRSRQHHGTVTTFTGEVAARKVALHQVTYGSEGSQNDVDITWDGQFQADGPRLRVYATKVECVQFVLEPPSGGACASVGGASGFADRATGSFVQNSLVVTNGRGNPDVLGSPPEYKLWVVGDAEKTVRYSITITWFYGPDC
jgi:hypothetical protein